MAGFVTCGPNEALVVSGCCHRRPLMVPGGRVFVWPVIQKVQRITLNTMTLTIESPRVYTQQGVPISVTGIAQVKIQGQNADMLRAACEQFLGKSEEEIMNVARETLEGHQRAIMASMTVEEIYKNRKKFSKKVFEVASSDLVDMGFTVVSYTIKDISDEEGYLKALGLARTAEVKRDARIGEAEAKRDALIKEALAEEERMAARYVNDAEIAKAQRDFELKKAAYDVEVFSKKAESDLAYNLQAAKTRQRIKEEQMQVKVIERTQEIQVQEQEIARKEKELEATVRRPAEAEKYKLEKLAEAHRNKIIMEAEAEAEALRLRGEAEAFAIEAKAKAEAEQMAKKANAYKEYDSAAKVDMVLDTLPKIAAEVAAPLAQCNKVVMVSHGNSEVGAGKLTGEVLDIITKVHLTVSQLTGAPLANSPGNIISHKKAEASKDRNFHRDRELYLSSTRSRSPQRILQNRSTSQDSSSPYSKQYHSYRRRNEDMSSKSNPNTRLGSEDRPKSATHPEPAKISAQERRSSAQEVYSSDKDGRRLSQTGNQSPTKRSERRSSSNGDIGKVEKKNETNVKLRLEELEEGEIDESNGLPSSTDANVSQMSGGNGERVASPVGSNSSSMSSCNLQVREALTRANKGSARKGFLRGVVTTEQHDKQTKLLNAVRANSKTGSSGENTSPPIQTRINSRKGFPVEGSERAKKTFVMPLPPNSSDKASQPDLNSSQDESSSHSTSTPGTPSKRRKRHYKGGTYGLYLSKKRKKAEKSKKQKESNTDTRQEGEESSQSVAANSESDGELDNESSISSNADNNDEQEANQSNEQEVLVNEGLIEEYVEEVSQEEVVNDLEEIPLNTEENVEQNEDIEIRIEAQNKDNDVNEINETNETNKADDSTMGSPKKGVTTQSSSSSIIDSVKNRPRSKRKVDGEEVGYLSPPSSTHSKAKPEEGKQSPSPPSSTSAPPQVANSESPKVLNGSPVRNNVVIPSNSATQSVIQNPNRRTLLRISTAGSIQSGDTHGTYLGAEQSKFIMIPDKSVTQSSTCLCSAKPLINSSEISKGKPMFCQAIDCFDEKLIGCCNQVRLSSLFRSSKRVPYRVLCEVHLARLRRHHCCPGCGLFCTQGEFLECFCTKKQIHLFHKKCQIDKPQDPKSQRCLHCSNVSLARSVRLEMNGPLTNNTYYLQQTSILKTPKARISMSKKKGKQVDRVLEEYEEPGIEYTIPATKKTLSLAGLPLGPQRKQLEELLNAISLDKQSPNIKLTIQHNKNFYAVAKSGEIDKVLSILAQGFDPNFPFEDNDNETPLHAAASCGHLLVVHLLIQSGANPNVLNKNMTTPIMQAIENKHNSVVKYLINAGASLDIRGEDGMTSLHIAAKSGNIEAVHYIVNSGKMNVNLQDDGGWSALVWATEHKHYNIVKLLVSKGADPNIEDDEENIGLHWAAFSGETNIASLFLEMGPNTTNQTNVHGDTPLHIASRRDNYECVVLLLSRGADISLMNKNNESPLQCAPKDTQSAMALKINQELKRYSIRRTLNSEKLLHRDLSKGKEHYQIQVVNGVDNEPYPIDFMYVTENCEASPINIDRTITSLQSCQCDDDCTSQKCVCSAISFRCWYDKEGKLLPEFNLLDAPMIFECNRACSCWKTCNNRVVQFGVRSRLQVFRTKSKGWGVRALRDIPRGTFVCEYVGEIISDSEADRREDDSYLFDLDNKDGETYCLDARFYGNICRFINHLCSPNLIPVKVFVDHQDLSFPRIALFSSRDIKAYEELGFDYGEKFWVIKYKWFTCSCGSNNCKYNKETIHNTIENYYKRLRDEQISIASPTEPIIETI